MMIKYNGYYKSDPTPYEDSIANYYEKGYFHNGYYFLPNGKYLRAAKRSESKEAVFSEREFDPNFSNKYNIRGNELEIFFETGTEWEFSEVFEIASPEELKGEERTLRFVSW